MTKNGISDMKTDSPNFNRGIGIITLYGNTNFGNKLQNFAVQELLKQKGFSVETIICKRRSIKTVIKECKKLFGLCINKRERQIKRFSDRYLATRTVWRDKGLLTVEDAKEFDYWVVGSDQVWNPMIRLSERDNFFLRFTERHQRICISPSIGVNEIPQDCIYDYAIGLNGFPYLCCREDTGADILSKIADKKCEHLLDPTLVIPASEWRTYEEEVDQKENNYVMLFFLGTVPHEAIQLAERIKKETGAEIIIPSDPKDRYYCINPFQFINLIDKAKYVLTDSFHAIAFSINMNTPFYAYDRHSSDKKNEVTGSRITSITSATKFENRYSPSADVSYIDACDFSYANNYLYKERIRFHQYLDRCLEQKDIISLTLPENGCTGCGVCSVICPSNCIQMTSNIEGFLYPKVDYSKCLHCAACVKVCPITTNKKNDSIKEVYAAYNTDELQLEKSSSGAVFPLLCEYVISKGGAVVGACYDTAEKKVVHIIAYTIEETNAFRTSKYIQSDMVNVLKEIKGLLDKGTYVLFSGTPCQVAGLKGYLQKNYSTLVTCDCACHGVPSPGLWNRWIKEFEKKESCTVCDVQFRDQSQADRWDQYQISYHTNAGKRLFSRQEDPFLRAFQTNLSLRMSCFHCQFKGWNRCSDITLADFWGIDRVCPEGKNLRGTSMVLLHTMTGKEIYNQISSRIVNKAVDYMLAETVNSATWRNGEFNSQRNEFFKEIQICGLTNCVQKYALDNVPKIAVRIKRKVKRILGL